ncbi:metallophosphoesterase family protein [Bacillus cereus]
MVPFILNTLAWREGTILINILHISDLHFPIENLVTTETQFINSISGLIESIPDQSFYLLISGDITFKGEKAGYDEATRIFKEIIQRCKHKIKKENILLCPGNHDISKTCGGKSAFDLFDKFSYSIRQDQVFTFSKKNQELYETNDALFLVTNSSFNMDHRYGYIDIEGIKSILNGESLKNDKVKIAIVHHHLINQFQDDISVLRNAYPFLSLLDHHKFDIILHGHQHNNMVLPLGHASILTFGVNTPGFVNPGYTNGISYYKITKEVVNRKHYIYSHDHNINGSIGGYQKVSDTNYTRR